jgi:hypothetical protein
MRAMIMNVSLLLLLSTSALAGQIYKWVDAQGVTHFDAQPPAGQNATPIETRTPPPPAAAPKGSAPAGTDDKQKAADAKVRQEVSEAQQRTDEFCDQARTNLAQLTNNPRVRQEMDGELRRLTEEERQAKITETKASIADSCQ